MNQSIQFLDELNFRKSTLDDIDAMEKIAEEGKLLLKSRGINQWQRGNYPSREIFIQDVADGIGYVVTLENEVAAVCAVTLTKEPSYESFAEGKWLTDDDAVYATIHRCATAQRFRGRNIAPFLFSKVADFARANGAKSIRIDTHPENQSMQHALSKSGFTLCGLLYLVDGDEVGDPRYGYEILV
ncbi:MAG: GNAT family N-acetyltransferase [Eubacteriales bacterium]|nr:GNAT family N-acetyltransferase [Eubacteriales bacterium]